MEDLESLTVKMMLFISFVNYFVCVFPSPTKKQNKTKQNKKTLKIVHCQVVRTCQRSPSLSLTLGTKLKGSLLSCCRSLCNRKLESHFSPLTGLFFLILCPSLSPFSDHLESKNAPCTFLCHRKQWQPCSNRSPKVKTIGSNFQPWKFYTEPHL